jgi:chitodextrinase
MTVEAWVMATGNPPDDGTIVAKSGDSSSLFGWQFKTTPDTGVRTFGIGVAPNGSSIVQRYSRTVLALNTWYHVAGVYNASAQTLDIYVNGVLDDGTLSGTIPASQYDPNTNLSVGKRSSGFYFQGTIDEVRIYNSALSQAQVQADMNTPVGSSAALDTTVPTAPTGVVASGVSTNQVNVSWTASTDSVGVTGYLVERSQGSGSTTFTQVSTPSGTNYTDTGLQAGTVYNYRVRATDAAGNLSGYSAVATATTLALPDTTAPTVPTSVLASGVSTNQVNVSWTASTDNVGVTGYLVERSQGSGSTTFIQVGTSGGTNYSDTGLLAGTIYNYRVGATDAAGNRSGYSAVATATTLALPDTTAPTAPTGVAVSGVSTNRVNVSWTASTDNVGVTGYLVERSQGSGSTTFTQVGTSGGTNYSDTGLQAGTVYNYRVRATDAAGNRSAYSAVVTATTLALPDTTAPTAPTGLAAQAASSSQINLSWTASTDNVGVTGYRVERRRGSSGSFTQIGTTSGTTYNSTGLSSRTSYSYRVRATDAAGNLSGYSNVASATTTR